MIYHDGQHWVSLLLQYITTYGDCMIMVNHICVVSFFLTLFEHTARAAMNQAHSEMSHREGLISTAHRNSNLPHVVWFIIIQSHECFFDFAVNLLAAWLLLLATVRTLFFPDTSMSITFSLKEHRDGYFFFF